MKDLLLVGRDRPWWARQSCAWRLADSRVAKVVAVDAETSAAAAPAWKIPWWISNDLPADRAWWQCGRSDLHPWAPPCAGRFARRLPQSRRGEYPLTVARCCTSTGCRALLSILSIGANPKARALLYAGEKGKWSRDSSPGGFPISHPGGVLPVIFGPAPPRVARGKARTIRMFPYLAGRFCPPLPCGPSR